MKLSKVKSGDVLEMLDLHNMAKNVLVFDVSDDTIEGIYSANGLTYTARFDKRTGSNANYRLTGNKGQREGWMWDYLWGG